jgi:AcrR family transcriptional regulator
MGPDAPSAERTVNERLLDAALEVAADHGLSRLSVGDVAKRAGLSRQTLYKHFASKEDLVSQTVIREAGRIVEAVIEAADGEDDPLRSLELAIVAALELVRDHPLLDRLVATEPETLLPLLVEGHGSVLGSVQLVCRQMIAARFADLADQQSSAGADLLSRMLVSYAVRPPELDAEVVARSLSHAVAAILVPPMSVRSPSPAAS